MTGLELTHKKIAATPFPALVFIPGPILINQM